MTIHPDVIRQGFWTTGSGPRKVLILGSCRIVPYINYFHYLNSANQFTIHAIDVVRFHSDRAMNRVELAPVLDRLEKEPRLRVMLESVEWFFHEHTENYGPFNTERAAAKNIWQLGMKAPLDVSLPNWNNLFILFQDLVGMDQKLRAEATAELGRQPKLSPEFQARVRERGILDAIKFCHYALNTDLPEMADIFTRRWRDKRYFWSCNHITKHFTMAVFRLLNEKFMHLDTPRGFWDRIGEEDMYESPHTPMTQYDVDNYGLTWPEKAEPLKL